MRRYIVRYGNEGAEGLLGRRLGKVSPEEVALYKGLYPDRNVAHFYEAYVERHGGRRCCNWVKNCLYRAGVARRPRGGG